MNNRLNYSLIEDLFAVLVTTIQYIASRFDGLSETCTDFCKRLCNTHLIYMMYNFYTGKVLLKLMSEGR